MPNPNRVHYHLTVWSQREPWTSQELVLTDKIAGSQFAALLRTLAIRYHLPRPNVVGMICGANYGGPTDCRSTI